MSSFACKYRNKNITLIKFTNEKCRLRNISNIINLLSVLEKVFDLLILSHVGLLRNEGIYGTHRDVL
jgi:hypothetical protein